MKGCLLKFLGLINSRATMFINNYWIFLLICTTYKKCLATHYTYSCIRLNLVSIRIFTFTLENNIFIRVLTFKKDNIALPFYFQLLYFLLIAILTWCRLAVLVARVEHSKPNVISMFQTQCWYSFWVDCLIF